MLLRPDLSSSGAYRLGRNENRYSDRCSVEIGARDTVDGVEYTLKYNMDRHATQELLLLVSARDRHVRGRIKGGTHISGITEWSEVFGAVVMDRWPVAAADPISVHFIVGGRVDGSVPCFADWFAVGN